MAPATSMPRVYFVDNLFVIERCDLLDVKKRNKKRASLVAFGFSISSNLSLEMVGFTRPASRSAEPPIHEQGVLVLCGVNG
ncbi:hypothetical protein N9M41_01475 [Rhodopirellula sp.]|jgi:hypothetical protein|nr:hypothetical protein [Rhodopirellula sp.]